MARDRPRARPAAGISGIPCEIGVKTAVGELPPCVFVAATAIADNETGEFMVSPTTAANPTCERSGVTARPAKGISAAAKSAAEG
jgi:hypothetical protein